MDDKGLPEMETVDIGDVNEQAREVSNRLERVLEAVRWISEVNSSIQSELREADEELGKLIDISGELAGSLDGGGMVDFRDLNEIKNEIDHEENIRENIGSVIEDLRRLEEEVPKMVEALEKATEEDATLEDKTKKFLRRYD